MYLIIDLLILASITFVQARLAFTQSPTVVTVGKPTMLKWIGENHSLVGKFIYTEYKNREAPLLNATINSLFSLYYGTMMGMESYSTTMRQTDPLPGFHQRIFLLGLVIL